MSESARTQLDALAALWLAGMVSSDVFLDAFSDLVDG